MWLVLAAVAAAQSGFKPMFNGRDLEGWQIDTPGLWQFRDGMLVGKHDGLKYNDFLRTRKHYRDFEPLPTFDPLKAMEKWKKTGEHRFRRLRKDDSLGEEIIFETGPDGTAARYRQHSNTLQRLW